MLTRKTLAGHLVMLGCSILLLGCDPNLDSAKFNAYFYYPSNRQEFLGQVSGLGACQAAARSKAQALRMEPESWSYVCCLKTNSSDCAEKHK